MTFSARATVNIVAMAILSLIQAACVSKDTITRVVGDPERIEVLPPSQVSFTPGKTWVAIELAARSSSTGVQVFCDMDGTRTYRPRRKFIGAECAGQASFYAGSYDGSILDNPVRTRLADGSLLAIYEVEDAITGEFSPVASLSDLNTLKVFIDRRPVYRFQRGAVHVLARPQSDDAGLRQAFVAAFPDTQGRLYGQRLRTFQAICDGNAIAPTCGVGKEAGVEGPLIIQESLDGTRTILNSETGPAPQAPAPAPVPADTVAGSPPLVEGTPYAAFTPEQITAYCAQDWSERLRPDGRTEYNPCKRRDAFP